MDNINLIPVKNIYFNILTDSNGRDAWVWKWEFDIPMVGWYDIGGAFVLMQELITLGWEQKPSGYAPDDSGFSLIFYPPKGVAK